MERMPRSFEDERTESLEEEPNTNGVEENFEEQNERDILKSQLEKGLDFYCQLSGEKKEEVDIHPEQKLFFAYLDNVSQCEFNKPVQRPTLTEYGLVVENNLYGFNDEYKKQIIRFEAEQMAQGVVSTEIFYNNLENDRSDFEKKYIENVKKSYVKKAREPFLQEKKKVEEEVNSRYLQRTARKIGAEILCNRYPEVSAEEAPSIFDNIKSHNRRINDLVEAKYDKDHIGDETERIFKKRIDTQIEDERARFEKFKEEHHLSGLDAVDYLEDTSRQYQEEKYKFIVPNFMSKEEYHEYMELPKKIKDLIVPIYLNKNFKKKEMKEIAREFHMLQESVKVELGKEYQKQHGTDFDYPANKKPFVSQQQNQYDSAIAIKKMEESWGFSPSHGAQKSRKEEVPPPVPPVEKSRETLEDCFEKYYGEKDPLGSIDKMIDYTKKYLHLAEKYRRGEVKFGPTLDHVRNYISKEKGKIDERMKKEVEKDAYKYAEKSADSLGKKIASGVFGIDNVKDAYFTPAGCFVRLDDDTLETRSISPFDTRIKMSLDQNEAEAWEKTWADDRKNVLSKTKNSEQRELVNFVNHQFRGIVEDFSDTIDDETFKELRGLCKEFNFEITGLFGSDSRMNQLPTKEGVQILKEIMPGIAKFVSRVNFNAIKEDGHHRIELDGLMSNLKMALFNNSSNSARDAKTTDLVTIEGGEAVLNFLPYQKIIYDLNGNHEKASSVLYSCLGYELMRSLSDDKIKEFSDILGGKADITKQAVFRSYGVMVASPIERREIGLRTFFVSEFNKFAQGVSEGKFKEYFASLSNSDLK